MFKRLTFSGVLGALVVLIQEAAWAAGGGEVSELVVVADTRHLSGFSLYIANLYNENMWLFAVWCVFLTALLGAVLGFLMDFIMSRSGLDLGKTKKIEH
ncbi:MAG: DVU0150 family protein [Thermodesulfobacteriota bacterium]